MKRMLSRITANSGIYLSTSLLTRGIGILMIPVYTRMLTAADYGIMAVAGTLGSLLTTLLGCALEACVMQFCFLYDDPEEMKQVFTDILLFWMVVSGCMLLLLTYVGEAGLLDHLFTGIPFNPYLRLVLLTSYFSIFANLPLAIYLARQQSMRVMSLSLGSAALTAVLTIYAIVPLKAGALGVLGANCISAAIVGVISIGLLVGELSFKHCGSKLRSVLRFSLPLVPHNLSNWVLNLSDRFILGRYVSLNQVGIYSLGYQCGALTSLAGTSINNAVAPIMTKHLSEDRHSPVVPPLGTYAIMILVWVGLGVAVLGGELLRFIAGRSFSGTETVVSWVVLGYVFQGAYFVSSRGTWMSLQTRMVPVLTGIAGIASVALNVLLVPHWGIRAAAINTAITFALLAALHSRLAHKLYWIPWEFGKWAKIGAVGLVCYGVSSQIWFGGWVWRTVAQTVVIILGFPTLLMLARVFSEQERAAIRQIGGQVYQAARRYFSLRPKDLPMAKNTN